MIFCKREGVDFILAVGGGSVIDSAKAIGYGVTHDFDVWELYDRKQKATTCLPLGVVLTIAVAGSEMSDSSVITKEEGGIKRGYGSPFSRPKFAIMNPELTMTLPNYQTSCGIVDIMMHTMERYFTQGEGMEITLNIAESLLKVVMKNAEILQKDPKNYEAHAEIMWAESLSHNGLTGCGSQKGDWGYIDTAYYMLVVIANSKKTLDKINDLGFQLFDRNIYFLQISDEEAEEIITNI